MAHLNLSADSFLFPFLYKMKISYTKNSQTISVSEKEFDELQKKFDDEISQWLPRAKEYIFTSWYHIFMERLGRVEMYKTQVRFLKLITWNDRIKLDRNANLIIK